MASSDLLAQIQAGRKLKKAETNDRSAPSVETAKGGRAASSSAAVGLPMGGPMGGGGPPQLGGLFAGGMPKLKPAGQGSLAKPPTLGKPPTIPKSDISTDRKSVV